MKGRRASFDGLRALAVVAVVLNHERILRAGFFGVDVFFVLSGFLITGVLLGEWRSRGSISMKQFYARRALRLYPALLAMLVLLTHLGPGLAGSWSAWARSAGFAATYTTDLLPYFGEHDFLTRYATSPLAPTWSLGVEEQFYLLWPVALLVLLNRSIEPRKAVGGVIALAMVLMLAVPALTHGLYYFRPDFRFGELMFGSALSLALSRNEVAPGIERSLRIAGPCCVLVAVVVILAAAGIEQSATRFAAVSVLMVLCAGTVIATLAVCGETTALARALSWGPLPMIGLWSYGIYLWNLPVHVIVTPRLDAVTARWLTVVVSVGVTVSVAAVSHALIERPFLALKSRLRSTPIAGLA